MATDEDIDTFTLLLIDCDKETKKIKISIFVPALRRGEKDKLKKIYFYLKSPACVGIRAMEGLRHLVMGLDERIFHN